MGAKVRILGEVGKSEKSGKSERKSSDESIFSISSHRNKMSNYKNYCLLISILATPTGFPAMNYEPSTMDFNSNANRRSFIKTASVSTLATLSLSLPQIVKAAVAESGGKKIILEKNDIILFQGDSITDWGRDHNKFTPNDTGTLGTGYVLLTTGQLLIKYPGLNLQVHNRGISGNKVYQLAERWDIDALSIKPTVLSIHIGVNDFWHTLTNGYTGTIDNYITDYHALIDRTKKALPSVKLVICEPFGVKAVRAVDDKWYPTFDLFRKAAKDIANEYDAAFVPYQSAFDKALELAPGSYWTLDGVHPSIAGEALMAKTWMEVIG